MTLDKPELMMKSASGPRCAIRFAWARTLTRRLSRVAATITLFACSDDVTQPVPRGEVCGQEAPVRILELSGDGSLDYVREVTRVGGRRILEVTYRDQEDDDAPEHREVWSVGECGEAPILLDEDVWVVQYPEAWPETIFACDELTGEVTTLDPLGARPQNHVLDVPGCAHGVLVEADKALVTALGLVTIETENVGDELGRVVLQRFPEDPWTEAAKREVLRDDVRVLDRRIDSYSLDGRPRSMLDEVFVITSEDELVRLSLLDGLFTSVADNVRSFALARDGRWLTWQDLEPTDDHSTWPSGAIYLRDLETGTTTYIVDGSLEANAWGG